MHTRLVGHVRVDEEERRADEGVLRRHVVGLEGLAQLTALPREGAHQRRFVLRHERPARRNTHCRLRAGLALGLQRHCPRLRDLPAGGPDDWLELPRLREWLRK
eukprot:scaffold84554_cov59-Phaeocystis_antarctica.AAC.1